MNDIQMAAQEFGVLDRVFEGVCVLREDLTVLFWNRCLEEWTGIFRDNILGTHIYTRFPHLHRRKYSHRLKQIFEGGPPTIFSAELHNSIIPAQLPNGQWRIQHTTVTAVPTPDGAGFHALLVIQDVTDLTKRIQDYRTMRDRALEEIEERQRVEKQLRESQRFIQNITDSAPYLMYIYDLIEQRHVYANHQIFEQLGYKPEELQQMGGQVLVKLMHPEDFAQLPAYQQKFSTAQDGEILEWEYRMRHKNGEWRWLCSRELIFTRTSDGQPQQILGTARDITERRAAEEAVRWQTERERLMQLITQQIRSSLDLAEVLNTTVTQVRQFLQTDRVIILRFQACKSNECLASTLGVVAVESVAPGYSPILGETIENASFEAIYLAPYQQGHIEPIADIDTAGLPESQINFLKRFGVKADLVVPILQGERLWGLLMAHHCRESRQWMPLEIGLMKRLATQLEIAIQQAELYQQLQAANEALQRLATLDPLTQLANRRRFDEYLAQEWQRMAREQKPLSVILCDIDFFKTYNDTYGHQGGDFCLQEVAAAISSVTRRPADLVARYGGEEFVAILPNTDTEGAFKVAKTIRAKVQALKIIHAGSRVSNYVSLSLGVATVIPSHDSWPAKLVASADEALYQAKTEGRDRVQVYKAGTVNRQMETPQPMKLSY